MARLTKTLEYRRAHFLDDGRSLEQLVRSAWALFPTHAERTITFSDARSTCGLRARDCGTDGYAIHCARYIDGQAVGTVPTHPAPEAEVGARPPEPGENYLNSDLMALIKDNHVICLNCSRNAGSLRIYLQELFRKAEFPDDTRQFDLLRIGRPGTLAVIETYGVKSIDLKVNIAEATAAEVIDGGGPDGLWRTIKRNVGGVFTAVTARDEAVEQLRQTEQGTVTVSIKVPKGDLDVAKTGLDSFAEEVLEDEEANDFVIHLRNGGTIRPNEVSVQKKVKLEAAANSVGVSQAWDEMVTYFGELAESGQTRA